MTKKEKIDVTNFPRVEKEILILLDEHEQCLYGNIFKNLSLSQSKGAEAILSLTNKKVITNVDRSSFYQLNVELVK